MAIWNNMRKWSNASTIPFLGAWSTSAVWGNRRQNQWLRILTTLSSRFFLKIILCNFSVIYFPSPFDFQIAPTWGKEVVLGSLLIITDGALNVVGVGTSNSGNLFQCPIIGSVSSKRLLSYFGLAWKCQCFYVMKVQNDVEWHLSSTLLPQ